MRADQEPYGEEVMALKKIMIVFNERELQICAAWTITQKEDEIINITKLDPKIVKRELDRLKLAGVLVDGGKLDEDIDKLINTAIAERIKGLKT
jgi:predicted phosphohydrolase